jgi:hypothetical protein
MFAQVQFSQPPRNLASSTVEVLLGGTNDLSSRGDAEEMTKNVFLSELRASA